MRIIVNVIGIIALLTGGVWALQGANVIGGSVMSGQSTWLYVGIVLLAVAVGLLWWANFRMRRGP